MKQFEIQLQYKSKINVHIYTLINLKMFFNSFFIISTNTRENIYFFI